MEQLGPPPALTLLFSYTHAVQLKIIGDPWPERWAKRKRAGHSGVSNVKLKKEK